MTNYDVTGPQLWKKGLGWLYQDSGYTQEAL